MIRVSVISAAALIVAMSTARAADRDPREVTLAWIVAPQTTSAATIIAKPGDVVLKQPLVPLGYATLISDAVDAKTGNLVAPAGTPLLQLRATSGATFCVAANPKRTALARAKPGSPYLRACFQDVDADGRFESSAEYDGKPLTLPSVSGRFPKHRHALVSPAAYKKASLQDYQSDLFVGVRFDGFSKLSGEPVFKDVFGRGDETDSLNRAWPRSADGTGSLAKTGIVLINGARINVLENDGATLKLRIENSIPTGAFGVQQVGGNHFF